MPGLAETAKAISAILNPPQKAPGVALGAATSAAQPTRPVTLGGSIPAQPAPIQAVPVPMPLLDNYASVPVRPLMPVAQQMGSSVVHSDPLGEFMRRQRQVAATRQLGDPSEQPRSDAIRGLI